MRKLFVQSRLVMLGQLVLGIDERHPYLAPGQVTFRFLTASHKRKIDFALDEIRLGKHDALLNYAWIDSFSVLHDRELTGQLYGYDPDGDAITAQLVSGPTNGTLTFHPDGTFTYIPNTHYVGSDSFTYTWSDGLTTGNTATIMMDVYNNAPYAYDASFSVLHDRELNGQLYGYDPDGDAITAQLVSGPSNGTVALEPDGRFRYTPEAGYTGTDAFVFGFTDGIALGLAMAWITVHNTAPLWLANEFSSSDKCCGLDCCS
jgi:sugar lactone lactonase YvrE